VQTATALWVKTPAKSELASGEVDRQEVSAISSYFLVASSPIFGGGLLEMVPLVNVVDQQAAAIIFAFVLVLLSFLVFSGSRAVIRKRWKKCRPGCQRFLSLESRVRVFEIKL
jgi:hypothetical protein